MQVRKEGQLPAGPPFLGDGELMLVEGTGGDVSLYAGKGSGTPARVGRPDPVVSADLLAGATRVANTTYQAQKTTLVMVGVETLLDMAAGNDNDTAATGKIGPAAPPATTVAMAYLFLSVGAGDQNVEVGIGQTMTFVVPAGYYYRVDTVAGSTLNRWIEVAL